MVQVLEELKLIAIAEELMASVKATLTSAIHGQSVDTNAVKRASDAARRLLAGSLKTDQRPF